MAKIVDLEDKWAVLIGRLFIAFGAIEKSTHDCLKKWVDDTVYPHVKHMRFSSRINLVIDIVKQLDHKEENINNLISALSRAKELGKKRNIVAHNPLMLVLFQGEGTFTEAITHNTNEDFTMQYHELEEIVVESEEIYLKIINGITMFSLEDWDGLPSHTPNKSSNLTGEKDSPSS